MNRTFTISTIAFAGVVIGLYALPRTQARKPNQSIEVINVYQYPYEDLNAANASGYIAAFYALKKLGLKEDNPRTFVKNAERDIKQLRAQKTNTPQPGGWLHHDELAYILDQSKLDTTNITILDDLGMLAHENLSQTNRYKELETKLYGVNKTLQSLKEGTHIFIIDKGYEPGPPHKHNYWVTIIANKKNNTIRYAVIDPENEITKDDPHVQAIITYIE